MKKAYKQLRKKLKNKYTKQRTAKNYNIYGSVGSWVSDCGIKCKPNHLRIICEIFGSVPYAYQETDRKVILKYLKENKKWVKK